jgi:uncharacterized protein YbjT (DUF2867 family)
MKPILVTGVSGLFGGEVARQLVDHRDVAGVGVLALSTAGRENRAYSLFTESLSH